MRDITLEDTFIHGFTTRAFATGIPGTLGGTPVLSVLEGGNATPITSGVSISVDRASVTGLNEATIVATAANGYELGKSYVIYISTGTVDSVSVVGEVVGEFSIGQSAAAVDLANVTDGLGALKTLIDALNDPTLDAIADAVWDEAVSGHVGAGSFGKTDADILADTNELQGDDVPALIADVPTVSEFDARTLVAAAYFDPSADTVALVTTLTNQHTLAEIADAIWDEAVAGHVSAGSFGKTDADILADTNELQGDNVPGLIAALNDLAGSDILTQVNAALNAAISELGVAQPSATPSLRTALMLMYMMTRNKFITQTSGTDALEVHNDAGTKIASKAIADDGSDYEETKMISG